MTDVRKIRTQLRRKSTAQAINLMLEQARTDLGYALQVLDLQQGPFVTLHPDAPKAEDVQGFQLFNEAEILGRFF